MAHWLRKAPTSVVITLIMSTSLILLSVIGGFIFLTAIGADTTEFRAFANTLMNAATLALAGVGAIGGVAAASSSQKTETRTNGMLDGLVQGKVDTAVDEAEGRMSHGQ